MRQREGGRRVLIILLLAGDPAPRVACRPCRAARASMPRHRTGGQAPARSPPEAGKHHAMVQGIEGEELRRSNVHFHLEACLVNQPLQGDPDELLL